jgi:protein-glutamine gamma-glutamyltransferase
VNTPPLLLAAACALWGAQTGQWLIAAAAAAALEAPRVLPLRWNVGQAHFNRLSDFCGVLLAAVAVYLYFAFSNPRALLLLFQWLPVLLLPLALAQAWSKLPRVDVSAFVWTMRKEPAHDRYALNLGYPCFAVWLFGASAANARGPGFYAGLVTLAAWALWAARPRRFPLAAWLIPLAVAAGAGYGVQQGLQRAQAWLEETALEWLDAGGARTDPYRSRTDLGYIGELKRDDAIVLRVRAGREIRPPLLLHRASYNSYSGTTWSAREAPLEPRPPDGRSRWVLGTAASPPVRVTVFDHSPRGNPVLSLPRGTVEVSGLEALALRRNGLGTVQAESPPGFLTYVASVDPAATTDDAPREDDLRVPKSEQALLARVAEDLGLPHLSAGSAVAAIEAHFARSFAYSTYRPPGARKSTALADFLLHTRAGHCEYFATATALLLRAAGVPARYATGYSAQEYSRLENAYVVRARHAHAWVKAYVNGAWRDVDTTPAAWASLEDAAASSWWSPLADMWSWTRFRLSQIAGRARDEAATSALWAGVALLLAAWFGWRLYRQRRLIVIGERGQRGEKAGTGAAGSDSEFFLVERALARLGLPRGADETVMEWLGRIGPGLPEGMRNSELVELAALHYRHRFDPAGLSRTDRDRLRASANRWLAASRKLRPR